MKFGKQSFLKITPFLMVLFSMCFVETPALSASRSDRTVIENKSSQFAESISATGSAASKNDLAEQIRKQREAIEARENAAAFATNQQTSLKSGQNACDSGLRKCMQEKCGSDFSKCALDGDTMFGDKLNLCRRDLNCSGEEFKLFTTEIKADRDMNAKLSSYTKTIECGNQYNDCIQKECGPTFNKCLGKPAEDRAIKNCATLAKNCMEQDSGLSSRVGTVIGRLRENAEKEVKADEERMYKLRDDMSAQCRRLGAMFDERSFDCVYTVNFFAGEDQSTPKASRKAYAGNTFVCMQEWFGINVTTYKENAFRETRAQTAASSAMLGSGLGTATGLITSGAMGRALETQKAKKEAKAECKAQGGKFKGGKCIGAGEDSGKKGQNSATGEDEDVDEDEDVIESPESDEEESKPTDTEQKADDKKADDKKAEAKKSDKPVKSLEELKKEEKARQLDGKAPTKLEAPVSKPAEIKASDVKVDVKIPEKKLSTKDKLKISNAKAKQGAKEFGQKLKDAFTIKKK
jgi:hypothetical protein